MQEKREAWKEFAQNAECAKLVFVDESGINTNMTRRYGRAKGGNRVVDYVPLNTSKTTTVISSMRLDGRVAYTSFQGGTNGERFKEYLRDTLVPTLHEGDIVIMDNLSAHKVQGVAEIIVAAGAEVLYLPPYSPDLSPIEKLWSKMKSLLRAWQVRDVQLLPAAVQKAMAAISASDCLGWFSCSGY